MHMTWVGHVPFDVGWIPPGLDLRARLDIERTSSMGVSKGRDWKSTSTGGAADHFG